MGVPTKMNKYLWFVLIFAGIVNFFDGWCSIAITLAMSGIGGGINLDFRRITNPDFFTYFDIAGNPVTMGIVLSIAGIGVMASVSFKYLVDKHGRRPLTLWTSIAFITFSVLISFSPPGSDGLVIFLIFRILANYFLSADIVVLIMAEEAPNDLRGSLIGMVLALGAIGGIACGIIQATGMRVQISSEILLTTWQSIFFLTSIGYFFIIPLFFFLKETKRFDAMKKYEEWRKKRGLKPKIGWFTPWKKEFRRVMILGSIIGFLGTLVGFAQLTFFALYFAKDLNMSPELIGIASLPLLLATGTGTFIAGSILDRWGRVPTIHRAGAMTLIGLVIFSWPAVFVCGDLFNPLIIILIIAGGMLGIFGGTLLTTAGVILGIEITPTHIRSTAGGWTGTISRGATVLAPFLMMFGAEKLGGLGLSYQFMFMLMIFPLSTAIFAAYLLAPEGKGRELEEIVVTEIYTKQKKMREKKHKEPYYFYLLSFAVAFCCTFIYSLTTGSS
ncbi:MAG: MFS transporter, partial [Candidatus Helarchaeota archaeon]|nr:MFS transporter [Candidatus Helarchaeota archaeon]